MYAVVYDTFGRLTPYASLVADKRFDTGYYRIFQFLLNGASKKKFQHSVPNRAFCTIYPTQKEKFRCVYPGLLITKIFFTCKNGYKCQ